jgi:hypothetical protein
MADVTIENHGTIFLFRLNTDAAEEWVNTYVQDDAQFWGGALVVEYRYAGGLAAGMEADGLEVE